MKNKGFTLIELLAVIVILAIIALIAVPIILGIIDSTKEQANKRSIELYGDAIKNAVANYALNHPEEKDVTYEKLESENLINYDGSKVECERHEIYSDGTIYLTNCKVNNKLVEYEYGKKQTIKYYGYWSSSENLKVGGELPEELSMTQPSDKKFYLMIEADGNTVSSASACFKNEGKEYCLKGYDEDPEVFKTNTDKIKDAFRDVIEYCTFVDNYSYCGDFLEVEVSGTTVYVYKESNGCYVYADGTFYCN